MALDGSGCGTLERGCLTEAPPGWVDTVWLFLCCSDFCFVFLMFIF